VYYHNLERPHYGEELEYCLPREFAISWPTTLAVRQHFSLRSMALFHGSSPEKLEVLALGVPKEVIAV